MGRPKKFSRDEVLEKAIPIFWRSGFGSTSLQDLELATGVNKSGLYSEFENKEDLFLAALRYYHEHRLGREILISEPFGWDNIEKFLNDAPSCQPDQLGCFSINSMRELAVLPGQVAEIMVERHELVHALLRPNVIAGRSKMDTDTLCGLITVFFSGICIGLNLGPDKKGVAEQIACFMTMLRSSDVRRPTEKKRKQSGK
jgi:TetR/AcrR family transcriptional regulator, copper-responsive repressor